ncbi:MAG: DUF3501 family protein [Candidatus Thiodiazotropha sp. (ex Lucina aurantia)]|uniref:DUF3501 domain-containing protein n=2 Tax=Candidatus Thiodiazotropha TaxID=1913444 RepID=A0A7Z1AGR4_9GAMM|nr:DUF3501 family protein [Candidatus Thiodiazotropha endolucinida]MBT3010892.1 DUF3501 family protein [Candidatus Thiodiazotropha sp. (ex Lucina pensylvanica)]MBT3014740.1 DUF3501 family protein [Candidatus Thiodiazotropha taylori]MBT3037627.1 DUF3501 family protein [Candidatus Thiodiazotropha sp. (ex Codakia orbicularis)]MBV2101575.1 DUF3501 family protein [Candidatus Thiodiazotropha sp. (ex Lucina aurantia)]MBT3022716.1 DUF3501 family protein [Candidatus Thiodiazotropha taylori]
MTHLSHSDLYSLEEYARIRQQFRTKVIDHKKSRRLPIGPHAALYFEDELTMQYQIQEMLRIERIFEQQGIQDELDVYNPLIPDGMNWKATFMMEYHDVDERKKALARLIGIEEAIWVEVAGFDKIRPIANEDLERSTEEKTSAVHFLRFELTQPMIDALKGGATLSAGIDHPNYDYTVDDLESSVRESLIKDLH